MAIFFVSYTRADEAWAEWIAWRLEEVGHTAVLQKWDFRPGANFVLEMQRAAERAERTVLVLSPDYLTSSFTGPEWAAAFAQDPSGLQRKLVPVRVRPVDLKGLLGQIVHIDIFGLDEAAAASVLLDGIQPGRAKPAVSPAFPGQTGQAKPFPGAADGPARSTLPSTKLRRTPSDLEKRRFIRDGFVRIADAFRSLLSDLERENPGAETDFRADGSETFTAEVYVDGKLRANCRVWIGGMLGDSSISYAEGSTARMGNAVNESISLAAGDDLAFAALMNMGVGKVPEHIDTSHMTPEETAHYLWERLLWRLR
jgi:hypothetical protein